MLNSIMLIGYISTLPELRLLPDGSNEVAFTLEVEHDYISRTAEYRPADFIDCLAYNDLAISITQSFTKGSVATIIGRLQVTYWQDDDGKHSRYEVIVRQIYNEENERV